MNEDENVDADENGEVVVVSSHKKRTMILVLPLLIVIGVFIGVYFALSRKSGVGDSDYNIVQYSQEKAEDIAVFYDLPEVSVSVGSGEETSRLRMKLNLELSSVEDLKVIEILTPKLNDVVMSHIIELTLSEIKGSTGLYWLKEELLYRLNLAAEPVKIKNLNFGVFELQ